MKEQLRANWDKWDELQRATLVLIGLPALALICYSIVTGPVDKAGRAIKRGLGGESFVVYQCSRAQGLYGEIEAAKNLGVRRDEVSNFCNFYSNNIQKVR